MKKRCECGHQLWIEQEGDVCTIGLTHEALTSFGTIEGVVLPALGHVLAKDDVAVVIEACKAAIDIGSPLAGRVVAVHAELASAPYISDDKEGVWLYALRVQE